MVKVFGAGTPVHLSLKYVGLNAKFFGLFRTVHN